VPDFRVKKDVVPGMYSQVWFKATVPGEHHLFCAAYCGTSHSGMIGKVIALNDQDWKNYLKGREISATKDTPAVAANTGAGGAGITLADRGRELAKTKGCVACHNDTGASGGIAPTYKGLYGSTVELNNGSKVTADDNYIRESIVDPAAKVVKGYNPVMPMFKGLLKEDEINALIAYIKSVK
jgi:cytochrome c oxidase subunit 2